MKFTRAAVALMLLGSLSVTACGDDDPTGVDISAFAGTWTASSIVYTSDDQQQTLDATQVGAALTMVIQADGDFNGVFTVPGFGPQNISGTIELEGSNEAHVDFEPDSPFVDDFTATYQLNNNTLVFTNADADFDFPPIEGTLVPSVAVITMTRTSTSTGN